MEAFLWCACAIWFLAFIFGALLRWWEILERRELKLRIRKKIEEEGRKKAAAVAAAAARAQRATPLAMKAEDAVLQQMAAAQL